MTRKKSLVVVLSAMLFCRASLAAIRVACVGDSITEGFASSDRATKSYPAILQTLLGSGYAVTNFGYGGSALLTTDPAISYVTRAPAMYAASTNNQADILLIMLGTNDSNTNNTTYPQLGEFSNRYDTFIGYYTNGRANPPKVFVATIAWAANDCWYYGSHGGYDGGWGFSQDVIQNRMLPLIQNYATSRGRLLVDVNALTLGHAEWFADPVHPNDAGYAQIAQLFYRRILEETPPAMPTVRNEAPAALDVNSATWVGHVNSTGSLPTQVWVFWGPADGQTTKGSWANSLALGYRSTGQVMHVQGGLTANTTYYYRFYASNSLGATWAIDSASVATPLGNESVFDASGWQKKARLTFDGYAGRGLADFPVLVKVNGSNIAGFSYSQCKAGGTDLRFTDSANGGNELFYEIEKWDSSADNATSYVWVRVRSLLAGSSIWMWWNHPAATAHNAAFTNSTWTSPHKAVWHMTDRSLDSTTNARSLTASQGGGSVNAAGLAGGAQYFATDREMQCAATGLGATGPMTIMVWAKNYPGATYSDFGATIWAMSNIGLDIAPEGYYRMNWGGGSAVQTLQDLDSAAYHSFVCTVTAGGAVATGYKNGLSYWQVYSATGQVLNGTFKLGFTSYNARWNGYIDEVRILNTAVPPDYVLATDATMANNVRTGGSGFTTYGFAENAVSGPSTPAVVNQSASGVGATNATLNGTVLGTGSLTTVAAVCWGTSDGGTNRTGWGSRYDFGPRAVGALSANVGGLLPGTTHYYRFYASNALGEAWAPAATSFTPQYPSVTGALTTVTGWRYHKGTGEASAPIDAWRAGSFSVSSWPVGSMPFWYVDGAGGTELTDMNSNYPTLYVRQDVIITNVASVTELILTVDYDDAVAVWVNGHEVKSVGQPVPPTYDAVTTNSHECSVGTGPSPMEVSQFSAAGLLVPGVNSICAMGFNRGVTNSDFHLNVSLQAVTVGGGVTNPAPVTTNEANWTAYNDFNWDSTQPDYRITTNSIPASAALVDYGSGTTLAARVVSSVSGGTVAGDSRAEEMIAAGSDVLGVFSGKVDCVRYLYWSAGTVHLSFENLAPDRQYNVVLFGNRGLYADRRTQVMIDDVDGFVNHSSTGAVRISVSAAEDTTQMQALNNAGRVWRYDSIRPGTNGTIVFHLNVVTGGSGTGAYVNAFMIQTVPTVTGSSIPDAWALQYFATTNVNPAADADGDGLSNLEEYIAGCSPISQGSVPRAGVTRQGNGFTFDFSGVSQRVYMVDFKTNLLAAWQVISSNAIWADGPQQVAFAGTNSLGYYRFRVRLAP